MMQEGLPPGKNQEILPAGTALGRAQELWQGLNVEARTFGLSKVQEGKTVELDNGSWIRIAIGVDFGSNDFVTIYIKDNSKKIGVMCTISSNGRSSFQLLFPRIEIIVDDSTFISDTRDIPITPGVKDEEKVMSAFVDWARESIDEGTVTEPPYKLENVLTQIRNPQAPTP